jgi:hypothetical protein
MSTTIKPPRRPALAPAPHDLTPAELSLIVSFRQMRGETQKAMVHAFKNMAMDPTIRRVQRTHLRLVVGDAS